MSGRAAVRRLLETAASREWLESSPSSLADQSAIETTELIRNALKSNQQELQAARRGESKCYRSPAFGFVKLVKGAPSFRDLSAWEAAQRVEAELRLIFSAEPPGTLWERALGSESSNGKVIDPYDDFLACWDSCVASGLSPLDAAYQQAGQMQIHPRSFGPESTCERDGPFRFFLTVAELLQRARRGQSILLPTQRLAELFGTSAPQISRWRKRGVSLGFLREVKAAAHKRGRATEFVFERPGSV